MNTKKYWKWGLAAFLCFDVGCLKAQPKSDPMMLGSQQCHPVSTMDQRIRDALSRSEVKSCATLRCRLGRVMAVIRAESKKQDFCQPDGRSAPLTNAVRLAPEFSSASLVCAASSPLDDIPDTLAWNESSGLSKQTIEASIQKYAPDHEFPVFLYQFMTMDYVEKKVPKDLLTNYARTIGHESQCRLDHTSDCMIRSFSALSGLSYCEMDFLKFGIDHSDLPLILNQMVHGGQFKRSWLAREFLGPKEFLERLLRHGGIGSYIVGIRDATQSIGHATVMLVDRVGGELQIFWQDFQQLTQVEGLPVDFRFRLRYSSVFRSAVRRQIPESTVFFDSLAALDRLQHAEGSSELQHRYLSFNALKISDKPIGVVGNQNLLPYLSQLMLRPK